MIQLAQGERITSAVESADRDHVVVRAASNFAQSAQQSAPGSIDPGAVLRGLWRHREIVWVLSRRDVQRRYRGSVLGVLWSFCQPLAMLAIYAAVFGGIFHVEWHLPAGTRAEFALVLFAGLTVYTLVSECVSRAPTLILGHPTYVKKVVFPLDVLPWIAMGSALFHAAVGLAIVLAAQTVLHGWPGAAVLALPLVLLPCVLFTMAASWFLAALGVYVRDTAHSVGLLLTALLFLSPVFYPLTAVPEPLRAWLWLNPLTPTIEQLRAVIFLGAAPAPLPLAMQCVAGFAAAWAGRRWFERTRPGFADVL